MKQIKVFCPICVGKPKKCKICKLAKDMTESERDHTYYLLWTWFKLKKYNMQTTNCKTLDAQVICMFGHWRNAQPLGV